MRILSYGDISERRGRRGELKIRLPSSSDKPFTIQTRKWSPNPEFHPIKEARFAQRVDKSPLKLTAY